MTPVFNEFDRYKIRLWKISDEVISPLLRLFLIWGTDWEQKIKFLTCPENRNVEINKLKRKLYPDQLKTLQKYPTDVAKWDITLICLLLKHCKGVFAGKDDTAWSSANGKEPECLITCLKDIRNSIAHEDLNLNQKDFFDKIEEIRTLMERALCSVGKICSHVSQTEIDANVANFNKKLNEIRDADISPKTLDEYKKELFFSEQIALIRNRGVPFLKDVLNRNTTINPLSLIVKGDGRQLPVNEIFTEIELNQDGKNEEVLLEDIIDVASGSDAGSFILLKGHAGMGKSTLVKKITSDWANQRPSIKGLSSFHLLFYAELRDIVNTFDRLIECSLGEEVHHSFKDGDLVKAVLGQKTLVILDGYDEVNKSSSGLFNHILSLNKLYSQLTVIVTTRPEAEEKLNAHLQSRALNAVHLRLIGIKANKREEFVTKYFLSLPKDSPVLQELDKLLEFLRRTEHKMSIVWEVAYNLCLLTILWMFKPDDVNRITTEAELYWQIFLLIISKLEERLQRNPSTCDLELSVLRHKIAIFLEELSLESLKGLKDDFINLPDSVYQRLTDLCLRLGLPIEELAGAFLKKVTSFNNSYYTFPHKGFMEFLGGYNIYKQMTNPDVDPLAIQKWSDELSQTSIPLQIQLKTLALLKSTKTTSVTDFVKELHGGSLPDSLEKYQNLLIQTLSIFHVGGVEVPLATKIETLELLEKSGLKDKDSFLKVMHNIKCNDELSRWIAQRFRLIDNNTRITDSSFESYIALLAATDPPLQNREEIRISINLEESISGFEVLTKHLLRHQVYPRGIWLHRSFREFTSINAEETESIKSLLSEDCEIYKGIWNPTFQIPPNVKELRVGIPDQVSLDAFCRSLQETKEIKFLGIHFSVKDVSSVSHPISFLMRDPNIDVLVSDVQEEDIEKVGDILRALQPQDAMRSFSSIYFPRCSKKRRSPRDFLLPMVNSLKGVRVEDFIYFTEDERPGNQVLRREMDLKAKKFTGCRLGVRCSGRNLFQENVQVTIAEASPSSQSPELHLTQGFRGQDRQGKLQTRPHGTVLMIYSLSLWRLSSSKAFTLEDGHSASIKHMSGRASWLIGTRKNSTDQQFGHRLKCGTAKSSAIKSAKQLNHIKSSNVSFGDTLIVLSIT
ncbi:uncharacterized protein [Palaemon carinicauda]|uniref:uncharacterized protein n=1 Tax=Palaemon carinicauda TaxID=392227 RepID=UPI0035B62B8D